MVLHAWRVFAVQRNLSVMTTLYNQDNIIVGGGGLEL